MLGILEEALRDILPRAKEYAVKSPELERRLGVSGAYIRRAVNSLRSNGVPVCSDSNGYWISVDPVEIRATITQLNSRAASILAATSGLERWI
ncbi:MAG: HTH domain-containing protein [Bacteroidales bacterium]|nr:HTH domain-containing protein [Candidatus Equimonas faecalis]